MSEPKPRRDNPDTILVDRQIRDLRKAKGLTIAGLAGRIERSVGHVSQIERNLSGLSVPDLKRIALMHVTSTQEGFFMDRAARRPILTHIMAATGDFART